ARSDLPQVQAAQQAYNQAVAMGAQVTARVQTPSEQYADTLAGLYDLLRRNVITQETYNRTVHQAYNPLQKVQASQARANEELRAAERITTRRLTPAERYEQ